MFAPQLLLLCLLLRFAGLALTVEGEEPTQFKEHCKDWLQSINSVSPHNISSVRSGKSEKFLRHHFGEEWLPVGNPTKLGPALTCQNEMGNACLYDYEFLNLFPQACRLLKKDADWPVQEAAPRTDADLTAADLLHALQGRRVMFVGASIVRQMHLAAECAVQRLGAGHGAPSKHVEYWGNAGLWRDNGGCTAEEVSEALSSPRRQEACLKEGPRFEQMLGDRLRPGDLLLYSYHYDHYAPSRDRAEWWGLYHRDLRYALETTAKHNITMILATPTSPHFQGKGSYDRDVYYNEIVLHGQSCVCEKTDPFAVAQSSTLFFRNKIIAFGKENSIPVIDLFAITMDRFAGHKGSHCGVESTKLSAEAWEEFRSFLSDAGQPAPAWLHSRDDTTVKVHSCCDCTHWCYTPLFWDRLLMTPLTRAIVEQRLSPTV